MMNQDKFDIFIKGEVVDLCIPSKKPWVIEQWYKWFNDPAVTRYLTHGGFYNNPEKQEKFYESLVESETRIALLIKPKKADYFVGIASLSAIDLIQRQCDFAMVIGKQDNSPDSIFYALETKALMTEHAFEKLGSERISSGQFTDLIKWQRWQILFGYQIEGIRRKEYRKGYNYYDSMISSCLLEDYLRIKKIRNGYLWPGKDKMFELLKKLPKETTIDRMQDWLVSEREKNWDMVENIEEETESVQRI
ncbi:MAG: GNAT family N-acetyltransferase [Desulfotalea sp.]